MSIEEKIGGKETRVMTWHDYGIDVMEMEKIFAQMVRIGEARIEEEEDEEGKKRTFKVIRKDGKLLYYIDKENLTAWIVSNS